MDTAHAAWTRQKWDDTTISSLSVGLYPQYFLSRESVGLYSRRKFAEEAAAFLSQEFSNPDSFQSLQDLLAGWMAKAGGGAFCFLLRHIDYDLTHSHPIIGEISRFVGNAIMDRYKSLTKKERESLKKVTGRALATFDGIGEPDLSALCEEVDDLLVIENALASLVIGIIEECARPDAFEVLLQEAIDFPNTPAPLVQTGEDSES